MKKQLRKKKGKTMSEVQNGEVTEPSEVELKEAKVASLSEGEVPTEVVEEK